MKKMFRSAGVLTFGLCVALVLSPSNAAASSDDLLVDVNVLSKEAGKSSLLDVTISDLPIVGDINVTVPSRPENATDALATLEVDGGLVDELDVSMLEKNETKAAVATVELESSLTDEVEIDIVSADKKADSFDGGVIEVTAEDLPLLGESHVGVVDAHTTTGEDKEVYSTGLLQADVNEGLLNDASVNVLATEKTEEGSTKHEMSAAVDISIQDIEGIADDLEVSVLKRTESDVADASESKRSLASVELAAPLTDELNVDVALNQKTANSFDGGLVEITGADVPLLGETHVGVLDRHLEADGGKKSFSTGLIQTDVGAGLLDDTSVGVLVRKMEVTEDGGFSSSSGATLDLGLPGTDRLSADVLKNERQFDLAIDEPPSVVDPPVIDEEENEELTPPPSEESGMPEISSDGNEDDSMSDIDQGSATPPVTVEDPADEGAENNTDATNPVDEEEQELAAGLGSSGNVDADSGARTGNLSGTADASAFAGKGKAGVMSGFAMNNADPHSSLPKTGGFWDGKRLAILALLLVVLGSAMRRMGKVTTSAA